MDVWCACIDQAGQERLAQYRRLLSEDERRRLDRFAHASDRRRYLVTRALLRCVLSRYASVPPAAWVFTTSPCGAPRIATACDHARLPSFNVSHAGHLVVVGISPHTAVGIDTEDLHEAGAALDTADQVLSEEEVAALHALPPHRRRRRFLEHWTLKEAYGKARGVGLAYPLRDCGFSFESEGGIVLTTRDAHESSRWTFRQFAVADRYLVSVCAERQDGMSDQLTVRGLLPPDLDFDVPTTPCFSTWAGTQIESVGPDGAPVGDQP